jgi:predicted  nucleic acid-binding Zn-ribbon protein
MNPAFQLSRLQKIDTELDQISQRQQEIIRLIQDESIVDEVKARLDAVDGELSARQKVLQGIEDKNNQIQTKLQDDERSLYGGNIRLPRELQDLQNEIASLKKQISVQDEQQFDTMMQIEDLEKQRSMIKGELAEAQSVFATHVAGWKGENSSLDKKKENLSTERNAAVQNLDETSLQKYESLRKTKRGLAVALVSEQACTACGATLTPADWQAARSPQRLVLCTSCGRILYAG